MKKILLCNFVLMLLVLSVIQLPVNAKSLTSVPTTNSITNTVDSLDVTLSAGTYSITTLPTNYQEITMTGYGMLLEPGKPMLPTKTFYIGLPPGCIVKTIELLHTDSTPIPGEHQISLAPAIASDTAFVEQSKNTGDSTQTTKTYPSTLYNYLGMSHLRKYALAMIQFTPITYNLESKTLLLHESITLRIHFIVEEPLSTELLSDTVMDDFAAQLIYNYNSIQTKYQVPALPGPTYDYVVITTSSLVGSLNGLLTWKTFLGYNVNIVTLTWILTNYPASDTQKSIRDFLVANYVSWGIKYVLIVGTHASIPMRTCYPDPSNHAPDGIHDIPTDYYYADLTGNWDSDGDGFYGERGQDSVDFTPEVWVGRIPTDGPTAVSGITVKIQNFEQTAYTGWKKNAMLLGAIYGYANEDNSGNPFWDGAELMELCKNNILSGFSITTMYEKQGLSPSPYPCTMNLNNANIIAQWGSTTGWGIIDWAAHGLPTQANQKVWNTDNGNGYAENNGEIIWPIMIQYTDNGFLNDAMPPIVFAASCFVSHPETGNNLGASLLTQGASAFIGAARTSWGSVGWNKISDGGHETVCYDFTDRIANKNQDCGSALYNAKQYVYNNYAWNAWQDEANMYNFNLYGDPSMAMNLPPGKPAQPSGPTSGIAGFAYAYTTQAIDPTGDKIKYGWDWNGDGTMDQWDDNNGQYYYSGVPISTAHVFSTPGTYSIQVKAEDLYGRQSGFSNILTVIISQNQPPTKPVQPSGPATGKPGTSYSYSTSANDPELFPVAYGWDWNGDGTVDQWDDNNGNYYTSGQTITTSHTWTSKGTYKILVKAKDFHGNEGPWSDPLTVTMPFSYQIWFVHILEHVFQWLHQHFPFLNDFLQK